MNFCNLKSIKLLFSLDSAQFMYIKVELSFFSFFNFLIYFIHYLMSESCLNESISESQN